MTEAPNDTPFDHETFLRHLTRRPGVYRMIARDGGVLYVGKARDLRARVASYFRSSGLTAKTLAMVARIADIKVTVTNSETEALLLEQSLIKAYRPPYNVLLRDDKSYPFIRLTDHADFPRLTFYRGAHTRPGRYFGPYPSASAVRETLNVMQKLFRIRSCTDTFFKNRTRPCLQYQIERCTAPCVSYVSAEEYRADVRHAVLFLEGRSEEVMSELQHDMDAASDALDFERAAKYRDQIAQLRRVQEQQAVVGGENDVDVVVGVSEPGGVCVEVMSVRGGRLLGSKDYFPRDALESGIEAVLTAFISQYYLGRNGPAREIPREILTSHALDDAPLLAEALGQTAGRKVAVRSQVRGQRARWIQLAIANAEQSLATHLADRQNVHDRFVALAEGIGMEQVPQRLECFDISHTAGERPVASCVVFDVTGPVKSDYRRFNISEVEPGDDYAAMGQALERRYLRLKRGEGRLPDILFIDGGRGQVAQANRVLEELQIEGVQVVGVAKGRSRKPGLETLIDGASGQEITLSPRGSAMHLIQHIRDEAHRFAITGHRQRRGKQRTTSELEGIEGVGPKRRRELLQHFGGVRGVKNASVEELARVRGISRKLAEQIYGALHSG